MNEADIWYFLSLKHLAIQCHWSQRPAVIGDVLQVYSGFEGRASIFHETKKNVTEMAVNPHIKQNVQCSHGDIAQSQREITLKGFREGSFKVLVATNVAARGLDIPEVDLVIQSSPPQVGNKFFPPPILLKNNSHTSLYKFKP